MCGLGLVIDAVITLKETMAMHADSKFEASTVCLMSSLAIEKALKGCLIMLQEKNLNSPSLYKKHDNLKLIKKVFPQHSALIEKVAKIETIGCGVPLVIAARYPNVENPVFENDLAPFPIHFLPCIRFNTQMASECLDVAEEVL